MWWKDTFIKLSSELLLQSLMQKAIPMLMLCAVKVRVLAYWHTGSAFHQIPQSYLNDVHLVPSVVLVDNELLTKVPMDTRISKKFEFKNIVGIYAT